MTDTTIDEAQDHANATRIQAMNAALESGKRIDAEAARKAAAAPDKEKLLAFADRIDALAEVVPKMETKRGAEIAFKATEKLVDLFNKVREAAGGM